jgi:hypothetical protein
VARREERGEVGDLGTLRVGQITDPASVRVPHSEPGELVRQAARLDRPKGREELDERDAGRIGRPEEGRRGWPRP